MTAEEDPAGDEIEQLLEDARPSAWFRRRHPEVAEEFRVKAVSRLREIARTDDNDAALDRYFAEIGRGLFASQDAVNWVRKLFGQAKARGRPNKTDFRSDVRLVLRVRQLAGEGKTISEVLILIASEEMRSIDRKDGGREERVRERVRVQYQRATDNEHWRTAHSKGVRAALAEREMEAIEQNTEIRTELSSPD